jgi:hypothetical protein
MVVNLLEKNNFFFVTGTLYYPSSDSGMSSLSIMQVIKSKNEIVGACGKYGGEEMCIQGFHGKPEEKRLL